MNSVSVNSQHTNYANEQLKTYRSQFNVRRAVSPFLRIRIQHRVLIIGCFAAYFVVAVWYGLLTRAPKHEWVMSALALYIAVLLAPLIFYKSSYGWLHPVIFGILLAFGQLLRSFTSYAGGIDWHLALPNHSTEALAQLVAYSLILQTVALLAYYTGFFLLPTAKVPRLYFGNPRNMALKATAAVAFACVAFVVYVQLQGGLTAHILSWGLSRHVSMAGEFYLSQLTAIGGFACLVWLALNDQARRNPWFWVCVAVSLSIMFLTSGSRSDLIYFFIIVILLEAIHRRKIPLMKILSVVAVAIVALGVLGEFRKGTWGAQAGDSVNWSLLRPSSSPDAVATGLAELTIRRSSEWPLLAILARVPNEVDLLYGDSYLAVLTLPVPRGLWTWGEKPGLVGGRAATVFFNQPNNAVPPSPVGEAYWNFHIPGIIAVFILFGVFHKWLVKIVQRYPDQAAVSVVYVVTLWYMKPEGQGIVAWLLVLVPVVILLFLTGACSLKPSCR